MSNYEPCVPPGKTPDVSLLTEGVLPEGTYGDSRQPEDAQHLPAEHGGFPVQNDSPPVQHDGLPPNIVALRVRMAALRPASLLDRGSFPAQPSPLRPGNQKSHLSPYKKSPDTVTNAKMTF